MKYVRIKSYYPDGKFTYCEHLYYGDSHTEAILKFRKEYPAYKDCILVAETIDGDDEKNKTGGKFMRVKFTQDAKKYITVADAAEARKIIEDMRGDDCIKDYGKIAARIASGENGSFEILKAEAEIAYNGRIYNQYSENSGKLDVWMNFYAYDNYIGFYEIGAYLSDIWQSDGTEETTEYIKSHMYIKAFPNPNRHNI